MPYAYEGEQPYIFVSYSHRDNRTVHRIIEELQNKGYRVWFDGGIEAGSEWPEYIATHLEGAACVLAFISDTFVESHNCKRELNFAQELQKPLLNVYIEDVELTAGMRMQLGLSQALFRKNYSDEESFLEALARAKILEDCRETVQAAPAVKEQAAPAVKKGQEPKAAPATKEKQPMPPVGKRLMWATALLELSYCVIGGYAMSYFTASTSSGAALFALMLIPHSVIALVNLILMRTAGKGLSGENSSDLYLFAMVMAALSSVIGVVVCSFNVSYQMVGVLKFLIALGLNIVPSVISIGTYFAFLCVSAPKK